MNGAYGHKPIETAKQLDDFVRNYFTVHASWRSVQTASGTTEGGKPWESITITDVYTDENRIMHNTSLATEMFTFLQLTAGRGGQHFVDADWYMSRMEFIETPDDDGRPSSMRLVLEFINDPGILRR
jgi:hypothetical protein